MKIEFEVIRWKNFLSTGKAFTEMKLNENRTTLIIGGNGAGKSTLLDALSYLLYGKAFRNVNKPQLVNSINQKHMLVEGEFRIGPNTYKIRRGMKPNIFDVFLNDKLLNQDAATKDYQDILEKHILRLNHKSFCQVVVLGSASFVPFMKLPAAHRREIIEDLLDLGIFTTMNQLNKEHIKDNQRLLSDVEYNIRLTNEKIKMHKKHVEALMQTNLDAIEEKKQQIKDAEAIIETYENDIELVNSNIDRLLDTISDQAKVQGQFESGKKIKTSLSLKLTKLNDEVKFFTHTDVCPTCSQSIEEHFKQNVIECKSAERIKVSDGMKDLETMLTDLNNRLAEVDKIKGEIEKFRTQIVVNKTSIKGLQSNIVQLKKDIENILKKTDDEGVAKDNENLNKELTDQESAKESLIHRSSVLRDASIILQDSGIKARFIKQYVPIINKLINKYLAAMEFFVSFELDETFNEKIKSRHRDEFTYASFSEGEKMRINLAILFAWRTLAKMRNSAATNILIMDEVFDSSLDSTGTEEFMKILNNVTQDTHTFIISHKGDQLVDKFENVIVFEKHKDFSRIVE